MTTVHTLVFAEQEASSWGAFWLVGAEGSASLAYLADGTPRVLTAELRGQGETEPSQLEGDGVSLVFSPTGPAGRDGSEQEAIDSLDQLCAVSGTITFGATEREIDCLGWRARVSGDFDLSEIDTFRQTYGWFGADDGVGLLAFRPRKSRGHDRDLVAAAVLAPEAASKITDPRLSSTYDSAGTPVRVGLELWFETDGGDGPDDEDERQLARRAAGEAIGSPVQWDAGGFGLQAVALRWHSRGSTGAGVYLLGQHA